ncbi:dihydropteroate synthase [Nonomuraea roseoviolacea subsp. roseoviolacea]
MRLRHRTFGPGEYAVMAVVNRTPDSFYDKGRTYGFGAAVEAVDRAVEGGADIVDIGGVKAGPGDEVDPREEIRRVAGLVEAVRDRHPELIISVDTWRAEVGDVVARAGADLLNDTWGGPDPGLAEVAARHGIGLVCAHAGPAAPRTRPHRVAYADVVADVVAHTVALASAAVAAGVPRESILIDPAHDFGKNTYHSLEVSRRLGEMTATGWPVLVAVSNKDFVGETLGGLPVEERHAGTIATLAVSALLGARVFRVHDAASARTALKEITRLVPPAEAEAEAETRPAAGPGAGHGTRSGDGTRG